MALAAESARVFLRLSPERGEPAPGHSCAFSPNGAYLAIGQRTGRCVIWDCFTRGVAHSVDIAAAAKATAGGADIPDELPDAPDAHASKRARKRPRAASESLNEDGSPVLSVAWSYDSRTLVCASASMSWVLATIDADSGCVLRFFDFGTQVGDPYPSTVQFHPVQTDEVIVALSDGSVLNVCTLTGRERYFLISPGRRADVQPEAWPVETFESVLENGSSGDGGAEVGGGAGGGGGMGRVKKEHHNKTGAKQIGGGSGASSAGSEQGENPEDMHRASVLSPDGALLFVGVGHDIVVFDVPSRTILSRQNVLETPLPPSKANCAPNVVGLTIDQGGQLLVVNVSHRMLRVYGVIIEASLGRGGGDEGGGKRSRKNVTLVWTGIDLSDAVDRRTFRVGEPVVCGECIIAAGIDHHKIYIWEASSGRHLSTVSDHWRSDEKNLGIVGLASHPERILFASCAIDGTVCFWSPPVRQDWLIKMQGYVELFENQEEPVGQQVGGVLQKKARGRGGALGEDVDVHVFRPSTEKSLHFIMASPRTIR
jgi:WD40 repeat protein